MVSEHVFRLNDIRGVYGEDITEEFAYKLGKAYAKFIGTGKTVFVSRDYRKGGKELKDALIKALVESGINVKDIGITTTPILYFAIASKKADGGIIVTASHNPPEWNGFKMCVKMGRLITKDAGMDEIKSMIENGEGIIGEGSVVKEDVIDNYIAYLKDKIKIEKKMKVVLDNVNGASCKIAKRVMEEFGAEVVEINSEPSSEPARDSNPTENVLGELKEKVKEEGADIGIAFDGDGDRIGFIDENGKYAGSGNLLIPIFSSYILKKEKGKIVIDFCCSSSVEEEIKRKGGIPIVNKVGHSLIMERMDKEGAVFGGEYSGHYYFSEIYNFDDALFAALRLMEIMSQQGSLSSILKEVKTYPATVVEEIQCDDKIKHDVVEKVKERFIQENHRISDIDGVKAFSEDGWVLARASGTSPQVKVNSEASTMEKAQELHRMAVDIVKEEIEKQN